jgi:hypothetical protein
MLQSPKPYRYIEHSLLLESTLSEKNFRDITLSYAKICLARGYFH